MDKLKLEYLLKRRDITRETLTKTQEWSATTYYRKISGESDWTIEEVNRLIPLGFDLTEIIDIFFGSPCVINDTAV